jgi:hypothetical protein
MQTAVTFPAIWLESRPHPHPHQLSPASKLGAKPNSFLDCTFHLGENMEMPIIVDLIGSQS